MVLQALKCGDEICDVLDNPIPSATQIVKDSERISVALHKDCVAHQPQQRPGVPSNVLSVMSNISQELEDRFNHPGSDVGPALLPARQVAYWSPVFVSLVSSSATSTSTQATSATQSSNIITNASSPASLPSQTSISVTSTRHQAGLPIPSPVIEALKLFCPHHPSSFSPVWLPVDHPPFLLQSTSLLYLHISQLLFSLQVIILLRPPFLHRLFTPTSTSLVWLPRQYPLSRLQSTSLIFLHISPLPFSLQAIILLLHPFIQLLFPLTSTSLVSLPQQNLPSRLQSTSLLCQQILQLVFSPQAFNLSHQILRPPLSLRQSFVILQLFLQLLLSQLEITRVLFLHPPLTLQHQ